MPSQRTVRAEPEGLAELEMTLGHRFERRQHLVDALTHRSYVHEYPGPEVVSNERLEFLGDAVLAIISSDVLYREYPASNEGELTQLRAALVRASTLAGFARRIGVGRYLRLGRSEETTGGRDRELLLSRAFEAVVGAVYMDGGMIVAWQFVEPLLRDGLREVAQGRTIRDIKDDKSLLQELAQGRLGITPRYRVASQSGPAHERIFAVEVLIGELVAARGEGRNKQQAEQSAAHAALQDQGWADEPPPAEDAADRQVAHPLHES